MWLNRDTDLTTAALCARQHIPWHSLKSVSGAGHGFKRQHPLPRTVALTAAPGRGQAAHSEAAASEPQSCSKHVGLGDPSLWLLLSHMPPLNPNAQGEQRQGPSG